MTLTLKDLRQSPERISELRHPPICICENNCRNPRDPISGCEAKMEQCKYDALDIEHHPIHSPGVRRG